MMFYEEDGEKFGVLNDYDLAALMKPGDRCPNQSGWERTGTVPFMAIELLKHPNGELKRWYRYELESSAWCLAYHMLNERPKEWLNHDFAAVAKEKGDFLTSLSSHVYKPEWAPFEAFLNIWLKTWRSVRQERDDGIIGKKDKIASRFEQDNKVLDDSYIRASTEEAREVVIEGSEIIESLKDNSWVDVKLKGEDA